MSYLQQFLRENGNLQYLKEVYALEIKSHPKYPNLMMFNYNQIESPLSVPTVQECRGIILDSADNWRVVNMTYTKFFNYGEGKAAKLRGPIRRYEKRDGSLCQLYWYDRQWQLASSGSPDASGIIWGADKKFSDLFWETWNAKGYKLPENANKCYAFEMTGPLNKIVVRYPETDICLHGVRNMITLGEEYPERSAEENGWKCAEYTTIQDPEEAVRDAANLNALHNEGYVLVDSYFSRVKVKCPQYVAMHHLKDGMSQRRLLEIARSNETEEFLIYFPEYTNPFTYICNRYSRFVQEAEELYSKFKDEPDQCKFAQNVKDRPYSSALFQLRAGKCTSIREFFKTARIQSLEQWLDLK